MEICIRYFGVLAEKTGCHEELFGPANGRVSDVLEALLKKYPQLEKESFRVAQNKSIVERSMELSGEEIALLPPFSGG